MEKIIENLDARLDKLSEQIAVMNNNVDRQGQIIDKLSASFEKLTVFVEKTNANDKKIDALFKKVDFISENGTKNCPVNINRIDNIEKKLDKYSNYIISISVALLIQFVGFILLIIEHHLHL